MPILTFMSRKDSQKKLRDYPLDKGVSLTIGRLEDNDVVIRHMAVSGHHAKIDAIAERFLLTDLDSKNGTFVNDRPIQNRWLVHDDEIVIGKYSLIFRCALDEVRFPGMGGDGLRDATAKNETAGLSGPSHRKGADAGKSGCAAPILSFLSGGEGEMTLFKALTKIGRNASSDIVVEGLFIGQTSATIRRHDGSYYLCYVGGIKRPRINGRRVKDEVLLAPFDTIEIGPLKMQFVWGTATDENVREPRYTTRPPGVQE